MTTHNSETLLDAPKSVANAITCDCGEPKTKGMPFCKRCWMIDHPHGHKMTKVGFRHRAGKGGHANLYNRDDFTGPIAGIGESLLLLERMLTQCKPT